MRRRKILVVEDDLIDLMRTVVQMELRDYDLLSCISGNEAILTASAYRDDIALIMMDLMLPSLPGVEAIRQIRRFMPDVPILAMTAYGDRMRKAAMDAGATDFVIKDDPFEVINRARGLLK